MPELSLNVLDVTENSTRAGAKLVYIRVTADHESDTLTIQIEDDGCGMTKEQVEQVIPFYKYAAESTGGSFSIASEVGKGTTVTAVFGLSHIDRMPLGDISSTIHTLVVYHPETDFVYTYQVDDREFTLDTRELREILEGVPFSEPEVSQYIMEFLTENKSEVDQGVVL